MPWKSKDATKFTRKAATPKLRRQFADIANSVLSRGASEGSAIRQASGVIARAYRKGGRKLARGSKPKAPPMSKESGRKSGNRK